jgi:hypothetical protein
VTTRHGIYRKRIQNPPPEFQRGADDVGIFRNGVHQIFSALKAGALTHFGLDPKEAVQLEFHYREICQRFVYSLQHLNMLMQEMAAEFNREEMSNKSMSIAHVAGCHADHILTYLNSIVDDIACAIIHTCGFVSPNPKRPVDSMGSLKTHAIKVQPRSLAPVMNLLTELDKSGSWWELAFKQKTGGRQLLIHNHHYVSFQSSGVVGKPVEAHAFLMTPFAKAPIPHFFELLRNIFSGLCNWLDRLEATLTAVLRTRSSWVPTPKCPQFILPIGYPPGITHFHPDFFVLPLCNGSDPLPWTTTCE